MKNDKSGDKAAEAPKLVDGMEEGSRSSGRRADYAILKKRGRRRAVCCRSLGWQDRPLCRKGGIYG